MNTGLANYKFGNKNNWRRWVWNEIKSRLDLIEVNVRDAVVLYLCGPNDYDRKVAIEKGFKNYNLIAVDRDIKIVNKIRKNGGFAIAEDIFNLITCWNQLTLKFDVVLLDLCSNLSGRLLDFIIDFFDVLGFRTNNIIFVFNIQRGREKIDKSYFNILRDLMIRSAKLNPGLDKNHRGAWLFLMLLKRYQVTSDKIYKDDISKSLERMQKFTTYFDPHYNSYKSKSGLWFDSVVFNSVSSRQSYESNKKICFERGLFKPTNELQKKIQNKQRALIAIRSMVGNGTLKKEFNGACL